MSHPKISKTLMVTGLAGVLLFASACSGDREPDSSPTATSPSATTSATPSPAESKEPNSEGEGYGPTISGMPTLKELASDKNGTWRKTTILPDDPAFEIMPGVLASMDPNVKEMWSDEEIQEAHRLTVLMAVDMIDTPANGAVGDTASMEKWWEDNKDKFHPNYQEELYEAALNTDVNKPLVYKVAHRQHSDPALDYGLVYGEDKVHVKNREIFTTDIIAGEMEGLEAIAVTVQVTFNNVVEVDGVEDIEKVVGNLRYTFAKDETTDKFLSTGFYSVFSTDPIR